MPSHPLPTRSPPRSSSSDLTGVLCTSGSEREFNALRSLLVLRAQGLTFAQCAKRFGRHPSGVKWIWKKHFGDLKLKRAAEMEERPTAD